MKRIIGGLLFCLFIGLSTNSPCQINFQSIQPVHVPRDLDVFKIYVVGGTTHTACSYTVTSTSLTVRGAGLSPKSTGFVLADFSTYAQLETVLVASTALVVGGDGDIVVTFSTRCYTSDNPVRMTVGTGNCRGTDQEAMLTQNDTNAIIYTIPPDYRGIHIADCSLNAVFNGECFLSIYDGATSTNTLIRKEELGVSGLDGQLGVSGEGYFSGS